jgi:hypothetical protein
VTAEYGVMFKGSASRKEVDEVKQFSEHRSSRLTTRGGDSSLSQINVKDPADNSAAFNSWNSSIAKKPAVFSMQLKRIDDFAQGAKAQAISAAIDKYLGGSLLVESTWIESAYVLSGAQANAHPTSRPRIPRRRCSSSPPSVGRATASTSPRRTSARRCSRTARARRLSIAGTR